MQYGGYMLSIAICDDDVLICSGLEKILIRYAKRVLIDFEIETYSSGESLYEDLKKGSYYDLIFLDIELKQESGIEIGKRIREELKLESIQIVYISAYESYALDLFRIHTMDFLIKPLNEERIGEVLDRVIHLLNISGQVFTYKSGRDRKKVLIRDILYFKSNRREIHLVMANGYVDFYGPLEEILANLQEFQFFSCHKSYLVNYNQVKEFKYEALIMSNGDVIPVSQGKRKEVRNLQMKWEGRFLQ